MKYMKTQDARIEIAVAIARVKTIAEILDYVGEEEAFNLLWHLAFIDLYKLENFRIPK